MSKWHAEVHKRGDYFNMNQNQISNNELRQSMQEQTLRTEAIKPQISGTVITILFLIFLIGYCCGHICSRIYLIIL